MKNKNKLILLSLTLLLIASCDVRDDALEGLTSSLETTIIVRDQIEQEKVLLKASQLTIPAYESNKISYSIDASLSLGIITSKSSGYLDFVYDPALNQSSTLFTLTSQSEVVTISASVKNDLMNVRAVGFGLNILNIENQSVILPKAKLNELLNLTFLTNIDKSLISNYRLSSIRHEALFRKDIYFFEMDKDYLNQQINNTQLIFNEPPTIGLIYEPNKTELIGFIISGQARLNNAVNVNVKLMGTDTRYLRDVRR
jgi:hypothetical protein